MEIIKDFFITCVFFLIENFLNVIVVKFPIIDVNTVFKTTTAYIKCVILLDPSAPEINLEEINTILAKLPKINVGKLKSDILIVNLFPYTSFLIGKINFQIINKTPNNLLKAKPKTEKNEIKGKTKAVKIEEFKIDAQENLENCPLA